jgi:hypothetical protein
MFVCLAFSWRAGPVFRPARFVISRFGIELTEGRRSFQLRWDELGDPVFRGIGGQSFIVFGQSYSMGDVLDPMLPRIANVFEAPLSKIMSEVEKHRPLEPTADGARIEFGGRYPDNEAPMYAIPAFFALLVAFGSAPAFLYWSSYY